MAFREDPFMDDEFALPPLPATPLYNPNACQVVAHHDGSELILDAESTVNRYTKESLPHHVQL